MTPRFRRLFKVATPGWLRNPEFDGERVLFSLGKLCDAFAEKALRGLEARFPTRAPASANKLTGGDRGILLGRSELNADYAARLREWRLPRTHRVRGNAYEALLQIWHYWGGIYAATIDSHGLRHEILATDSPDVDTLADPDIVSTWTDSGNCLWDDLSADEYWSRFWLVVQPTAAMGIGASPAFGDPALWGGSLPAPEYTFGQTGVTIEDVTAMRALFQELKWGPAHTLPEWLVLCINPEIVSPCPKPTGNWQYWSWYDYLGAGEGMRIPARDEAIFFVFDGAMATREGAGTVSVTWPSGIEAGDLLFFHEGRTDNASSTPGASWTLVKDQLGFFASNALYAKIADGTEAGSFTWTCTGAGNHVGKVTRVRPPSYGWAPNVLDNFSEIASATGTNSSAPEPDNTVGKHRLNFVGADFFDVSISASSDGYTNVYGNTGNFNLYMFKNSATVSGTETSFSEPSLTWNTISLVLSRASTPWRFWSLDPLNNNTYAGERGRPWANAATKVDGTGTYEGQRSDGVAAFGAQTLPNGKVYSGNRGNFPARVLLLDDGSVPQ